VLREVADFASTHGCGIEVQADVYVCCGCAGSAGEPVLDSSVDKVGTFAHPQRVPIAAALLVAKM